MKQDSGLLPAFSHDASADTDTGEAERLIAMIDPALLGTVPVEMSATLGRGRLTIQRLADLAPGEVVSLDTPLNGLVDLSLNDNLVARGEIVAVGDQFGIRITQIFVHKE